MVSCSSHPGYSDTPRTATFATSLVLGVIVAVVALLSLTVHRGWSWVNVAAGADVIIASIVIGGSGAAIGAGVVLGAVIGLIALNR